MIRSCVQSAEKAYSTFLRAPGLRIRLAQMARAEPVVLRDIDAVKPLQPKHRRRGSSERAIIACDNRDILFPLAGKVRVSLLPASDDKNRHPPQRQGEQSRQAAATSLYARA